MTTDSQTQTGVAMCFGTAGGSAVVLTRHEVPTPSRGNDAHDCSWECLGCEVATGTALSDLHSLGYARERANQHAVFCRALPRDAWPAHTGRES